jgi:hypothetical protein
MNNEKKKGRPLNIKTPQVMWDLYCGYREQTKSNPILVQDYVGKDGTEVYRKKERPLTMEGFKNYCFNQNVAKGIKDYFNNTDGRYEAFTPICSRVKRDIRQDQIEGGMCGIYNPSITQRLNNLTEKIEQQIVEQPLFGRLNKT